MKKFQLILGLQLIECSILHHLLSLCICFPFSEGHVLWHLNYLLYFFRICCQIGLMRTRTGPQRGKASKEQRRPLALELPPTCSPCFPCGLCVDKGPVRYMPEQTHCCYQPLSLVSLLPLSTDSEFHRCLLPDLTDRWTDTSDDGQTAMMMEGDGLQCRTPRDPLLINYCFCNVRYEHP